MALLVPRPDEASAPRRLARRIAFAIAWVFAVGCARPSTSTTVASLPSTPTSETERAGSLRIVLADAERGRDLLGARDEYTTSMTALDLRLRLGSGDLDEAAYRARARDSVRDFEPSEATRLSSGIEQVLRELASKGIDTLWPDAVTLIKTTGEEELGRGHDDQFVGYTRGSAIVINSRGIEEASDYLLRHELFHVLTRSNPSLRDRLYATIGYRRIARLSLPASLDVRRITNPDAPTLDHAIRVERESRKIDVVNVLLGREPRDRETLFDVLEPSFVIVDSNGRVSENGQGSPIVLAFDDVQGYLQQIGFNTRYVTQPEEVLADNFVLLLADADVPSPNVPAAMLEVLRAAARR